MSRLIVNSNLLFILIFFHFSSTKAGLHETAISVIYDITSLVDEISKTRNETFRNITLENVFNSATNNGIHFKLGDTQRIHDFHQVYSTIREMMPENSNQVTIYISVRNLITLSPHNLEKANTTLAGVTGVILDLLGKDCSEISTLRDKKISAIKTTLNSHNIQLGFKYDPQTVNCTNTNHLDKAADFNIVKVDFTTQLKLPESYGIFKDYLKSTMQSSQNQTARLFPYLELASFSEQNPPETDLDYNLLLEQFARKFSQETGSTVFIQLSSFSYFPKLGRPVVNIEKDIRDRSKNIITSLYNTESLSSPGNSIPFTLNKLSSVFSRAYAWRGSLEFIADNWQTGDENTPTKLDHQLNITAELNTYIDGVDELSDHLSEMLELKRGLRKKNIYIEYFIFYAANEDKYYIHNIQPGEADHLFENTSSGCLFRVSKLSSVPNPDIIMEKTRRSCNVIFKHAKKFVWYFDLYVDEAGSKNPFKYYMNVIQPNLNKTLLAREQLLKVKPNAVVELKLDVNPAPTWIQKYPDKITRNFYCDRNTLKMNEYYEAIWNWARIHNFPVEMKDPTDWGFSKDKLGYWHQHKPSKEFHIVGNNVPPLLLMRNYPENVFNHKIDSCVEWTEEVPESIDVMLDPDVSIVTLNMNVENDSLNAEELKAILLLLLQEFKTIELIPRNGKEQWTDLQTLNSLLTTDFLEELDNSTILNRKLFLKVSVDRNDFPETLTTLTTIVNKLAQGPTSSLKLEGVTLKNWFREVTPKLVVTLKEKYKVKVGLAIQNCPNLINTLAKDKFTNYLPSIDYIICSMRNFPRHYDNKMEIAQSLDSHLYMRAAIQHFVPNLSVFYRLSSFPTETKNFLRFLNILNQFAVGNNLKYFLKHTMQPLNLWLNFSSNMRNLSSLFLKLEDNDFQTTDPDWELTETETWLTSGNKSHEIWQMGCAIMAIALLILYLAIIFILRRKKYIRAKKAKANCQVSG